MPVSYSRRQIAATLRHAAEIADQAPVFTGQALCLTLEHIDRIYVSAKQFAKVMHSDVPWDNDPRIDPDVRVLGLLFAAEFTKDLLLYQPCQPPSTTQSSDPTAQSPGLPVASPPVSSSPSTMAPDGGLASSPATPSTKSSSKPPIAD